MCHCLKTRFIRVSQIQDPLKQRESAKSKGRAIGCYSGIDALKFASRVGKTATKNPVKFKCH